MDYEIIYEKGKDGNYGAYVPALPGCIAVGETLEECEKYIQKAIAMHEDGMREDEQSQLRKEDSIS